MDPAKLAKLQAAAAANRIGGKGTVRRKVVRKSKPAAAQDDKKLQGALKKVQTDLCDVPDLADIFAAECATDRRRRRG